MIVTTRTPQFAVRAKVLRGGELAPQVFAGDVLELTTTRRLGTPAGTWTLQFVPRALAREQGGHEGTWADVFAPMDWVELSIWVPPRRPTVVMRGWVDSVTSTFDIAGGVPRRTIVVTGRDYGKLLAITQLYTFQAESGVTIELFQRWYEGLQRISGRPTPQEYLSEYPDLTIEQATIGASTVPTWRPGALLQLIFDAFLVPQQELVAETLGAPRMTFQNRVAATEDEPLTTFAPPLTAPLPLLDVWSLLARFQHRPWRELYVDDEADGPVLIYRQPPWLNRAGQPIFPVVERLGSPASPHPLTDADLVASTLSRSDDQVVNYVFTYPAMFGPLAAFLKEFPNAKGDGFMLEPFRGNPFLAGFVSREEDSDFRRHGVRLLELATPYVDWDAGLPASTLGAIIRARAEVGRTLNLQAALALDHAAVLEVGALTIRGHEQIHVGDYVQLQGGGRYYVEGLQHRFRVATSPSDGHFLTELLVTRGRGHLFRREGRG